MQKHVNCGAFGSVDKITCHMEKRPGDETIDVTNTSSVDFQIECLNRTINIMMQETMALRVALDIESKLLLNATNASENKRFNIFKFGSEILDKASGIIPFLFGIIPVIR